MEAGTTFNTSPTTTDGLDRAFQSLRDVLSNDDSQLALNQVMADCVTALNPCALHVYRVGADRSEVDSLGLTIAEDASPKLPPGCDTGAINPDALDNWTESLSDGLPVMMGIDELPPIERSRFEQCGYSSLLLLPIREGRELSGVLTCACQADPSGWSTTNRMLCELAATATGIHNLRQKQVDHDRLMAVLAYAFDLISVVGQDGTILFNTPTLAQVLGQRPEELMGQSAFASVHPQDQPIVAGTIKALIEDPEAQRKVEVRLKHANGSWRQFEVVGTNQIDNPLIGGIVVTAHDVTDRKTLEHRLNWQALHDPLTKLANRALLFSDIRRALARAGRSGDMTGLLYLDLDGFKNVNDRLGHPTGDQLLIRVGERLRASARAGETVARLGGDEFVVLLEGLSDDRDAENAATRILEAIRMPIQIDDTTLSITVSIGISVTTSDVIDPDDLLVQADNALYAAKRAGRDRFQRFVPQPSGLT